MPGLHLHQPKHLLKDKQSYVHVTFMLSQQTTGRYVGGSPSSLEGTVGPEVMGNRLAEVMGNRLDTG